MILHARDHGSGAPVVLLHGEGLDGTIWEALTLPGRRIALDLRGHGASKTPEPPYAMGALVRDVEETLDAMALTETVLVGHALGGMVAQALTVKRLDLVRGLVLVSTSVRRGAADLWQTEGAKARDMATLAEEKAALWTPRGTDPAPLRSRIETCDPRGWEGACTAIAGTDLVTPTSGLRLPTLALTGAQDRAVPPDIVRELADLIPGAQVKLIRGAGHVPPLDTPETTSEAIAAFLARIGHG